MEEETWHARPTLRCLLEELSGCLPAGEFRSAVIAFPREQSHDPNYLLPFKLKDVPHPTVAKAQQVVSPGAARDRIRKVERPITFKVKSMDWRGALTIDDSLHVGWVLTVGQRRADSSDDFYAQLREDLTPLEPDSADHRYLRLENAYEVECHRERNASRSVIEALMDAAAHPGEAISVSIFGADVAFRFEPDEDDLVVLEASWDFQVFDEQDRFPEDVLAMVPGGAPIERWMYWPPAEGAPSPHAYQRLVPASWVIELAVSAELDALVGASSVSPPLPSSDGSEHFSHHASRRAVTLAYVTGVEIIGICGARVVAHRDYSKFPVCPACMNQLELLRATGHA